MVGILAPPMPEIDFPGQLPVAANPCRASKISAEYVRDGISSTMLRDPGTPDFLGSSSSFDIMNQHSLLFQSLSFSHSFHTAPSQGGWLGLCLEAKRQDTFALTASDKKKAREPNSP